MSHKRIHGLLGLCIALAFAVPANAQLKIDGVPKRNIFVGSQPISVSYTIFVKTGVEPVKEDLVNADVSPYTLLSVTVGKRVAIPQEKDLDMIQATIIVRPEPGWPLGEHPFPEITLRYGYDQITNTEDGKIKRIRRQRTATAPAIELEKVPLYVETDLLHERARIADENIGRLSIFAGFEAEVLNEVPPDDPSQDVVYLQAVKIDEPMVLLATERDEKVFSDFRVIEYRYHFSVMDLPKRVSFVFPAVTYKLTSPTDTEIKTVDVGSSRIFMDTVLNKDTRFEPPKGLVSDPPAELMWFFWLPAGVAALMASILALMGLSGLVVLLRGWRTRKNSDREMRDEEVAMPELVYQQRIYHRWFLGILARAASLKHDNAPSRKSCERLRSTAARCIVSHARKKISREQAGAMLVNELGGLDIPTSMDRWLEIVSQTDGQLERNEYVAIQQEATPEAITDTGGSP